MDELVALTRLLAALRPWLGQLVVVGGWAHRLQRWHPLANPPSYLPLRTMDADLVFAGDMPLHGDIGAALRDAGFQERFKGDHTPPVIHYQWGDEDGGFYAEFLAPLTGSGFKRSGRPDLTIAKAGVTAQKLRHLGLLLIQPWAVQLGPAQDVALEAPVQVLLTNPVSFIVQKLLIQKERSSEKQAQDILYIHDTIDLFAAGADELRMLWLEQVQGALTAKTAQKVKAIAREHFATVTDVIRAAARIPQDRMLTPERIRAVCALGLGEILGAE